MPRVTARFSGDAPVVLACSPTRRWADDADVIHLPAPFTAKSNTGEVELDLAPTGSDWCWMVIEKMPGGARRYVAVPDTTDDLEYVDLQDVDPKTLDPVLNPPATWWVALQAVQSGTGVQGPEGKSAYQVAVLNGFSGTQSEWLASLDGDPGLAGKSAYQVWLDAGNTGTQSEFLASLKGADGTDGTNGTDGADGSDGADGKSAYQSWLDNGGSGSEATFLASLKGSKGDIGPAGADGADETDGTDGTNGKSSYQLWIDAGNSGTTAQFLESLKGEQGATGADGPAGADGADGPGYTGASINGSGHLLLVHSVNGSTDVGLVKGSQGDPGDTGATGDSAYQVWLAAGNTGTSADFLASLKGVKGDTGDSGVGTIASISDAGAQGKLALAATTQADLQTVVGVPASVSAVAGAFDAETLLKFANATPGSRFDLPCPGGVQPLRPSARTDIFFDWLMIAPPAKGSGYAIDDDGWRREAK